MSASQVVEVGQVGALQRQVPSDGAVSLFAHSQKGGGFGDASAILSALSAAAQQEAAAAQVGITNSSRIQTRVHRLDGVWVKAQCVKWFARLVVVCACSLLAVADTHTQANTLSTPFASVGAPEGKGRHAQCMLLLHAAVLWLCLSAQVAVTEASASNPGIPPSSLMSFLRVKPSIQGVVLTEFDKAFTNHFYASRFDNGSRADAGSIAATAAVLAAALHRLAGGDPQQLQVRWQCTTTACVACRQSRRCGLLVVCALLCATCCGQSPQDASEDTSGLRCVTTPAAVAIAVCAITQCVCALDIHTRCCVLPCLHTVQVNTTDVQAVVSDYISCMVAADPGFACPLAASIMPADYVVSAADGSRSYAPRNYVGVLQWMPDLQVGV